MWEVYSYDVWSVNTFMDRSSRETCSRERRLVSHTFASWNRIAGWLRRIESFEARREPA
jgi:hypothetical protein